MHTAAPTFAHVRRLAQTAQRNAHLIPAFLATTLLSACDEAHPRQVYVDPVSDNGEISAWFYNMILCVDAVILAIVLTVLVLALLKFRRKPGDDVLPEQSFGNMKLEVAWTVIPTLLIVAITIPTLGGVFELSKHPDVNQKIIEVEVTGKQWWWEFDYKKELISTGTDLHVEVGTQVILHMTSADVIHSWWVPRIGGKRDATPGRTYPMYFRPNRVGTFDGQCAELCGASHALMGTKIIVHPREGEDSYENWVRKAQAGPVKPTTPAQEAGQKVFLTKGCVACHNITGVADLATGARSRTSGPNLTHVGSRIAIAGATLPNTPENIAKWVKNPQSVKPGALMSNLGLNDQEANDVAAYLTSLK